MLKILDIDKSFGTKQVLFGVSFEIYPGETLAVLGPSGCGKSTLLNIIAGLDTPDRGDIAWEEASLAGIPAYRRSFGLMFQDFALFPHQNVFNNVAFGLHMQRLPHQQIQAQVQETLELVGLPGFEKRDVNTLSGGEQQRVALARALAPHPRLLMLDEPLGSLDRNLRERLVFDLRDILRRSRQTALYVTHDQEEAFSLADRLVVMNAGKIEQTGAPQKIYRQPASPFVARFLGMNNILPATVLATQPPNCLVEIPIGRLNLANLDGALVAGAQLDLLLRPDAIRLGETDGFHFQGILTETVFRGSLIRASIETQGTRLTFDFPNQVKLPAPGQPIDLNFDPVEAIQWFIN